MGAPEPALIALPRPDEIPADLRPQRPRVKPRLLKIKPADIPEVLGWRVLVLPVAIPTQSEGGIALVGDTIRHMNLSKRVGVVLAMGPLAFSKHRGFPPGEPPIQVGDWVQFHESAGVDCLMNGEEGLVSIKYVVEADILARITNPDAHMVMV